MSRGNIFRVHVAITSDKYRGCFRAAVDSESFGMRDVSGCTMRRLPDRYSYYTTQFIQISSEEVRAIFNRKTHTAKLFLQWLTMTGVSYFGSTLIISILVHESFPSDRMKQKNRPSTQKQFSLDTSESSWTLPGTLPSSWAPKVFFMVPRHFQSRQDPESVSGSYNWFE